MSDMKPSKEYFSAERPFSASDDGCLLDALEQSLALMAECGVPTGWHFNVVRDTTGAPWIEIISQGDSILGHGKTLRQALGVVFNESHDPFYDVEAPRV